MASFASFDGVTLSYQDEGRGRAVVLLHGFAADTNINWVRSGVLDALVDEGYRALALDARGHGLSEKPHEPEAYADGAMTRDARALLDHLELERAHVVGYSMGASTALARASTTSSPAIPPSSPPAFPARPRRPFPATTSRRCPSRSCSARCSNSWADPRSLGGRLSVGGGVGRAVGEQREAT